MTNNEKLKNYQTLYEEFIFEPIEIEEREDKIVVHYYYTITNLTKFHSSIEISKKGILIDRLEDPLFKELVFHIGLVELLSYWKCCCSKKVTIKAGFLTQAQIDWFKKLYFYGLGEFFFRNELEVTIDDFMQIEVTGEKPVFKTDYPEGSGVLIPIGGGKDSVVSLQLLKDLSEENAGFIMNPKAESFECAKVAGYTDDQIVTVKRNFDRTIVDLNNQGFFNGHTPFSALVAFNSYLFAFLTNKKYIALSNEGSANQPNIEGTKINHQYSKSTEFELDFNHYTQTFFPLNIHYFSFLRPLTEYQIAMIFSQYKQYFPVFKSCGLGSKEENWKWCGNCPKCLFIFLILSPFLYKEELVKIYGQDLFEREDLLNSFIDMLGKGTMKPFDCVGTFEEACYATSVTIRNLLAQGIKKEELPYLLNYYITHYELTDPSFKLEKAYGDDSNLPSEFQKRLKGALDNATQNY